MRKSLDCVEVGWVDGSCIGAVPFQLENLTYDSTLFLTVTIAKGLEIAWPWLMSMN